MRKSNYIILVLVVILAVLIVGSSDQGPKLPIKIGATLPLSGKFSFIGEAELGGLRLAVEEINEKGGVNGRLLQLIPEDNEGDATNAVSGVNKLISIDNVDVVFSFMTHITSAISDIVTGNDKLLIYQSSLNSIAQSSPLIFKDYVVAYEHGMLAAKGLSEYGYSNIAYLAENGDACRDYEAGFDSLAEKLGLNILHKEIYQDSETDLRTNLLKVKQFNPEAIATCTWRHTPVLMKQMKELGMIETQTVQPFAPFLPVADTHEMRKLYEENDSLITWYGFSESSANQMQLEFIDKYIERYGVEPTPDSAYTYDDVYALAEALKYCSTDSEVRTDCLASKFSQTKHDGVGGPLSFNKDGISIRETFLIQIVDGEWEEVVLTK